MTVGLLLVNVHILQLLNAINGKLGAMIANNVGVILTAMWIEHALCGRKKDSGLPVLRA